MSLSNRSAFLTFDWSLLPDRADPVPVGVGDRVLVRHLDQLGLLTDHEHVMFEEARHTGIMAQTLPPARATRMGGSCDPRRHHLADDGRGGVVVGNTPTFPSTSSERRPAWTREIHLPRREAKALLRINREDPFTIEHDRVIDRAVDVCRHYS